MAKVTSLGSMSDIQQLKILFSVLASSSIPLMNKSLPPKKIMIKGPLYDMVMAYNRDLLFIKILLFGPSSMYAKVGMKLLTQFLVRGHINNCYIICIIQFRHF